MINFKNINDFINYKTICPFCKCKLSPSVKCFISVYSKAPFSNSKLKNDVFTFNFEYNLASSYIRATGNINILTNEIKFEISPYSEVHSYAEIIEIFEHVRPSIRLDCNNKNCFMDYYCCSDVLSCEKASANWGGAYYNFRDYTRINPLKNYLELFQCDEFLVQNDFIYNETRIFKDLDLIKLPLIDFKPFNAEKLRKRILTLITFS
jgi:hypothetical protein